MSRLFVGREAVLSVLDDATMANGPSLVHVSGPTGIGKTALALELEGRLRARDVAHRLLDPTVEELSQATIDGAIQSLSEQARERGMRAVLIIDGLHRCAVSERWLANRLRPLQGTVATLLADRRPPAALWHEASAPPHREIRLPPLREFEVEAYLERRNIPESHYEAIQRFAEGNPLLLSIACERADEGPLDENEVLLRLAHSLCDRCDSRAKRLAFAILTTADATTVDLLCHALGDEDLANEMFMWLRDQSVVDGTPLGLVPHVVARRACSAFMQVHHLSLAQRAEHAVASFYEAPRTSARAALGADLLFDGQDTLLNRRRLALSPAPAPAFKSYAAVATARNSELTLGASFHHDQFRELLQLRLDGLAAQAGLTDREREVFQLLILGRNTNEIGTVLGITPRTAKFHQQRVLEKIGADSRVDILRLLL